MSPAKKAFSLIEMLAVIAIIGLLAGILVPSYLHSQQTVKIAQNKIFLAELASAIEQYKSVYGLYPQCLKTGINDISSISPMLRACLAPAENPPTNPQNITFMSFDDKPQNPISDAFNNTHIFIVIPSAKERFSIDRLPEPIRSLSHIPGTSKAICFTLPTQDHPACFSWPDHQSQR